MRETLRGALLSVLFFGLLVGPGGVSVAEAEQWTLLEGPGMDSDACGNGLYLASMGSAGLGCVSMEEYLHNNACDAFGDLAMMSGIVGGVGLILSLIPEPFTSAAGMLGLLGSGIGFVVAGAGWMSNDC